MTRFVRRDPTALARQFWDQAGCGDGFPRPIERAVALVLPLTILRLPALNVDAIGTRLRQCGVGLPLPADGRAFMGCLVARRGYGLLFVDGGDDPAEQRLTIAHETAHFLLDYLIPRQDVLHALGDAAADVLDGLRPPTIAERAAAVLRHVRLGPHIHRLARDGNEAVDPAVADGEARADELALELLAPRMDWIDCLAGGHARRLHDGESTATRLAEHYGIPSHVFERLLSRYAAPRPVSFLQQAIAAVREAR